MSYPTRADVLLPDLIEDFVTSNSKFRYRVILTRDSCEPSARIDKELISSYLPPPSKDNLVVVCGTDEFVAAMGGPLTRDPPDPLTKMRGVKRQGELLGVLKEAGFSSDQVYKF